MANSTLVSIPKGDNRMGILAVVFVAMDLRKH